jgi:hypothetical protein
VLAVGARSDATRGSARYPVEPVAVRHGAGVDHETDTPYARFSEPEPGPPPDIC